MELAMKNSIFAELAHLLNLLALFIGKFIESVLGNAQMEVWRVSGIHAALAKERIKVEAIRPLGDRSYLLELDEDMGITDGQLTQLFESCGHKIVDCGTIDSNHLGQRWLSLVYA